MGSLSDVYSSRVAGKKTVTSSLPAGTGGVSFQRDERIQSLETNVVSKLSDITSKAIPKQPEYKPTSVGIVSVEDAVKELLNMTKKVD